LPCDPPVGGHSCNGGMIPRFPPLHCGISVPSMSAMGLGCAKTLAPAAHVETSRRNCAPRSRIVLRARCSIPCRRIVFSTIRNCMSFHTGWVISDRRRRSHTTVHVRFAPKADKWWTVSVRPLRAKSGLMHRSQQTRLAVLCCRAV